MLSDVSLSVVCTDSSLQSRKPVWGYEEGVPSLQNPKKKGALDLNNENKSTVSAGSFLNAYLSSNIRAGDGSAGAVACVLCTGRA